MTWKGEEMTWKGEEMTWKGEEMTTDEKTRYGEVVR